MNISATFPPKSAVEVFKLLPEGTLCEVLNNILYMSPAAAHEHQRVSVTLTAQIYSFVTRKKVGEIFHAPIDVFLDENNAFQPDIIFISKENSGHLIQGGGFEGAPDLVIEILSPFNKSRDLVTKRRVYERTGVKEYWIVDPVTKEVVGFMGKDRSFQPLPSSKGKIKSLLLKKTFSF